jgi:vacuolar-type H+-ATPase subunit I/STV1
MESNLIDTNIFLSLAIWVILLGFFFIGQFWRPLTKTSGDIPATNLKSCHRFVFSLAWLSCAGSMA